MQTEQELALRQDTVKEYFSQHSTYWDSLYDRTEGQVPFMSHELKRRMDIVFDLIAGINAGAIKRVLDLGCGSGRYLAQLAPMGFDCYGADISPEMLEYARDKLRSSSIQWIHADCCNVPMEDQYCDLIICTGVLEYLDSDTKALREIRRLIKPDGYVIITLPNLYKLRNLLNPYYYLVRLWTYLTCKRMARPAPGAQSRPRIELEYGKSTVNRYSLWGAGKIATASGFRVVEVRSCCFGPFSFWKNEIVTTRTSIKISNALEGLLKHKAFRFLRCFANRWVVLLQPDASPAPSVRRS
jgi:ubiquinone/menaquinone biosynthesis C-methylase UbiE